MKNLMDALPNQCITYGFCRGKLVFLLGFFLAYSISAVSQTSWKGITSTAWATATNWTNGVPTAAVDAIIGDANFTGANQPSITLTAVCKSLTIGGTVAANLTVNKATTVSGSITINSNGTMTHKSVVLTLTGNWVNSGTYTPSGAACAVTFAGTAQSISGTNLSAFLTVTTNAGSTVTLNRNFSITTILTVKGTLIPPENATPYVISGVGALTVSSGGNLKVTASTFTGNYGMSGTITLSGGSIVDYNASTANQTVSNSLTYSTLTISGGLIKTLAGNLPALVSSASTYGSILVTAGTLDVSSFTANRGTTVAGGTLSVSSGAFLKIGGTSTLPANFNTRTFNAAGTVEYYGTNQTISAQTYGNLTLSASSGAIVKTFPATAFTIAGSLTSSVGSGTSLSFTAAANLTITGNITIGASTTFDAATFTHTVAGNWTNSGTFTGSTSTITMSGASKSLSGTGTNNFNNIAFTGSGITAPSTTTISATGTSTTSGSGTFSHASGGTYMVAGTSKTIVGNGFTFDNLTVSGTITSIATIIITGNLIVNGTFSTTAGSVTMNGTSKTISGSGTISLFSLSASGSISTVLSFTITSSFVVAGSFSASAGTVTFTGSSNLNGTANLYNVTINGTSLQLSTNAVLGIANTFTISAGTLNVTTATPNTVNFNGSGSQTINNISYHHLTMSNGGTKTAAGAITTNGSLTIGASTTFSASSFTHIIKGNWINSGTFTQGTCTISFTGAADASITGATTFNIITISKSASSNIVTLNNDISVPTINMTLGVLNTGTNTVLITTTRTGTGFIYGNIQRTHTFTTGVAYEFEGPNNTILFSSVNSVSTITVKAAPAVVSDFPFGGSINRYYDITIPSGTYNATLRLHYEDAELNGNTEASIQTWRYNGSSWAATGKSANSTTTNYVEKSGLTNITNRWTLSDDANLVVWNGSVSNDWFNSANWTAVQGTPTLPPSINEIVQLGTLAFTNQPSINSNASAKSILFGSAQAVTLTLISGGSLTTQGNISGSWSANQTHTIEANSQNITVNGDIILSDGTASHIINLNMTAGTTTVNGFLTETGGANMTFSGSATLNITNDFTYTSGTFTASTGTVVFNGSGSQVVAGVTYNNLTINKSTGIATMNSATTVAGNLLVSLGELDISAASGITGNATISSGAILNGGAILLSVGGNWANSGTFVPGTGTVNFNGAGSQSISVSNFNNLTINKSAGVATLSGIVSISGNLTISAGILDIATYTANRGSAGGTLSIASGAALNVGGANNFPSNYSVNTLNSASTVNYNGTIAQNITALTYGNLTCTGGGSNAKTLGATTTVNGNLLINSGATFSASSFTLNLAGNFTNSGTFTSATSTVILTGTTKTLNGSSSTFYNLTVTGSYTSNIDLTYNSTLSVSSGGSLDIGTTTSVVNAEFSNNGFFISNGTVTFSGTVLQTIQLFTNGITAGANSIVNFNGTVAPALSSASARTFSTLNVNNTAGISPSVNWTITTAFTVASTATFNGTSAAHTFNGAFTNNGTISSSGTLNISPSSSQTVKLSGVGFSSTGTVVFGGTGAIATTGTPTALNNVTISNTVGVSPGTAWAMGGTFIISSGGIFYAGTYSHSVAGDFQSTGTLNGNTSTFTLSGNTASLSGSPSTTFYHLVITGTTVTMSSDFNIDGNLTTTGTLDASAGNVIFTGSGNATISGASTALAQFVISKTSNAGVTLARNVTLVSEIDINSGTLDQSTFAITQDGAGGAVNLLLVAGNAKLKIGGTNSLPAFTTYTLDSLSTVEYYGNNQTISSISALSPYGNLVISTSGAKTANGSLNIRNNFTLTNGTFIAGSYIDTLGGNWNMTSGTFTNSGSTITLNGGGSQDISSTGTFNNLRINKSAGTTAISTNITVNSTLTFTLGTIQTGSNTVIIPSGGVVSGTAQGTGWVYGKLQKNYATGANVSRSFEIGGSTVYAPSTVNIISVTTAGNLIVSTTSSEHASIASSGINSNKSVNRYWTFTNSGIVFTTAAITVNWVSGDLDAGVTTANFKIGNYNGSSWTLPTVASPNSTSIQATGVTVFGDIAVGELLTTATWTGAVSTDWSVTGNWSAGFLPTIGSNVTIPSSLSRYPVLSSGTGYANNLTLQASTSLSINSATLQIAGSISNSGTINASTGTIELNGTTAQTIPASTFVSNAIASLTVNNITTVTLGGTLKITDVLTISNGSLITAGFLILRSTSSATARIGAITSTDPTPISGNVTAERYIQGRRKYRLMTSAVTTSASSSLVSGQEALSIWGNWQNSGNNSTANTGTIITGGSAANGFDQQTTNASLYTYNDATRLYVPYSTANSKNTKLTPLKAGIAYYMFVYGDRLNNISTSAPNYAVLSATGTVLTGDQTYTTSSAIPLSNTVNRYTLLGNPFASPINWANVQRTNLSNTYWGWDPNLSSTGGYVTVSTSGTVVLISPFTGTTGLNQYIQSGQGFFVKTTASSPVLVIREQDKTGTYNVNAFQPTTPNTVPLMAFNLYYTSEGNRILADGAVAAFDQRFSNDLGDEDASKMIGTGESLAIGLGSELLGINARQLPGMNDTLHLKVSKLARSKYTLQIFGSELEHSDLTPYLEDTYLKTFTPLSLTDTNNIEINVDPSRSASSDVNRFRIVFHHIAIDPPPAVATPKASLKVFSNPVTNHNISFQLLNMESGHYNVTLYNIIGQKLLSQGIDHKDPSTIYNVSAVVSASGNYIISVTGGNSNVNEKLRIMQ